MSHPCPASWILLLAAAFPACDSSAKEPDPRSENVCSIIGSITPTSGSTTSPENNQVRRYFKSKDAQKCRALGVDYCKEKMKAKGFVPATVTVSFRATPEATPTTFTMSSVCTVQ